MPRKGRTKTLKLLAVDEDPGLTLALERTRNVLDGQLRRKRVAGNVSVRLDVLRQLKAHAKRARLSADQVATKAVSAYLAASRGGAQ